MGNLCRDHLRHRIDHVLCHSFYEATLMGDVIEFNYQKPPFVSLLQEATIIPFPVKRPLPRFVALVTIYESIFPTLPGK
jgi:hypothetical protein